MNYFVYLLFRLFLLKLKLTPFFALKFISWILYFFLYHVLGYRKKVVIDNLKRCFPEKSDSEIVRATKSFYLHLCDITLESLKGFSMSKAQLLRHYKIVNPQIFNNYAGKNNKLICLASHYGNWEWGILSVPVQVSIEMAALYKPLSNPYIDSFLLMRRAAMGMKMVSIYDTKTSFESQNTTTTGFIMAADQCPSNIEKAVWVRFFNNDTACLHGAEYYAMKYNIPILFFDVKKLKRNYYTLEVKEINYNIESYIPGTVTSAYMKLLEENIKNQPEYWLWSHKRWKHTR